MATNAPQDDWHKTGLRLPKNLHQRLHEAAAASGRSYNAEIVARLDASFDTSQAEDLPPILRVIQESEVKQRIESLKGRIDSMYGRLDVLTSRLYTMKPLEQATTEAERDELAIASVETEKGIKTVRTLIAQMTAELGDAQWELKQMQSPSRRHTR